MSAPETTRLHLLVAWRHLRVGEQPPRWVVPVIVLAVYLVLVGLGFSMYSAYLPQLEPETDPLAMLGVGFDPFAPERAEFSPRQAYYGMLGAVTLFVGGMLLIGGIMSRFFTLLATVISFSVMLGCMALVIVLSLMTGLEHELRDKILGQRAHILVQRTDGRPFSDYLELAREMNEAPGVLGASPYLEGEIMVRSGINRQGGILTGIIPELHEGVSTLHEIVVEGDYEYLAHPERIPEPQFSFDLLTSGKATSKRKQGQGTKKGAGEHTVNEDGLALDPLQDDTSEKTPTRPILDIDINMNMFPDEGRGDEDDEWEDPAVEIPKLRAAGELPPAPGFEGPAPDDGAPPGADDQSGARAPVGRDDNDTPPPSGTKGVEMPVSPFDDWDEGDWEDPSVEIPKLRERGVLPPQDADAAPEADAWEDPGADTGDDETQDGDADEVGDGDASKVTVINSAAADAILIGSEKAKELMVHLGEDVQLITPIGRLTPAGRIPGVMSAKIAGVFDADHYEYDRWLVYAPLRLTQAFLRAGDRVTGIEIKVDDVDQVKERKHVIQDIVDRYGRDELVVKDWQEINLSLFSAMALEKIAVFIALLCVILVASFGILGSNLMSVLEKAKEIAILKTMGLPDAAVEKIFITEGLCLGFIGSTVGIVVGVGVCLALDRFGLPLAGGMPGFEGLPVAIRPLEVALVAVSAMAIVWLSSLYPARVAARMRPVDAMRKNET